MARKKKPIADDAAAAQAQAKGEGVPPPPNGGESASAAREGDAVDGAGPVQCLPSRLADALILLLFLCLTFLLGVFPLKDTDFWWHLRTGDLIRQGSGIPVTDWYTFGAEGNLWVNLHWLFEVLLSWGHQHLGIPGLNLAKCLITTIAVGLLVTTRRKAWPLWIMTLSWLPALLLLGGRMYIRPETLTLLCLAIFLSVLERLEEHPRLAYILPVAQVFWVNTQGLFILGPLILGCYLLQAALSLGNWSKARGPWRRSVLVASLLTVAACALNPYGLTGALYPLQLARTMASPLFSSTIAELMPVVPLGAPDGTSFVEAMGFRSLPLQLHLGTLFLGALSFVLPILWRGWRRGRPASVAAMQAAPAATASVSAPEGKKRSSRKRKGEPPPREVSLDPPPPPAAALGARKPSPTWRLSLARLLLFAAFSILSLKATRNSHQFAACAGAITAWNFGSWAAALRRGRSGVSAPRRLLGPRLFTMAILGAMLAFVGSGLFYQWTGEGRTIGLGEEPLWFPHEATLFAGREEMPERFVCFHNGHAALYEYHNGPLRKVYADARLEVMGEKLYTAYLDLERSISTGAPGWRQSLEDLGNPGVLVDNVHANFAPMTATLLADPGYSCVYFDAMAAVFVPVGLAGVAGPVDFDRRHFQARAEQGSGGSVRAIAEAKAVYNIALQLQQRGTLSHAQPMILWGLGQLRQAISQQPRVADLWKYLGLLEAFREVKGSPEQPIARLRLPLDPVFDLGLARSAFALREALRLSPEDSRCLLTLGLLFQSQGLDSAALPLYQQLSGLNPSQQKRSVTAMTRSAALDMAEGVKARMGPDPSTEWKNLDELDQAVSALLQTGRAQEAAELLEKAYPPRARTWAVTDRMATLCLRLGAALKARELWAGAEAPPEPALVPARVALADYAAGQLEQARKGYLEALRLDPELFEAAYGLAALERDAGRPKEAVAAANRAQRTAPSAYNQDAAGAIAKLCGPYAGKPL